MRRAVFTLLAASLLASPVLAADPKVESAIKVFKAVSTDNAKLRTFCEMSKVMAQAGEKEDKVADAKIDALMKQLGADFEKAWAVGDGLSETSADGKAFNTAMDDLMKKCGA